MIKPYAANLINALTLMVMSAWGYFDSLNPSMTALIPFIFGIVLLALNNGVRFESKAQAHVAVILTLLVFLALAMPLKGAIGRNDQIAVFRVGTMMVTSLFALITFINSFINARKARKSGS